MTQEVIILTRSLPFHSLGGMEIVTWDLAQELVRLGHKVRVITTSLQGKPEEFEVEGVTIVALKNTPSGRYSGAWWTESRQYFEKNCMSSTQSVLSVSAAGFGVLPLKQKLANVPFVMQAHGTSWGEMISKMRSGNLRSMLSALKNLAWFPKDLCAYQKFDTVIAVGERVYRDLRKSPIKWFLENKKVRLINNGIDTNIFCPSLEGRQLIRNRLSINEQTPVIISASRLHEQKGVANCIKAFSELKQTMPNAIYMIAGDGPERPALESLVCDLNIADSVHFIGSIDRKDLAHWLQSADAFLFLTTHVEGLPLNVLEALASGLPSVVSEHLMLFDSNSLHYTHPAQINATSEMLLDILKTESANKTSTLPVMFSLRHAAQLYSEALSTTDIKSISHAHN